MPRTCKITGTDLEFELPDPNRKVAIFGSDTYLGAHLAHGFRTRGYQVISLGKDGGKSVRAIRQTDQETDSGHCSDWPEDTRLWLFCHQATVDQMEHISALRDLYRRLTEQKNREPVRIAYFSPAAICRSDSGAIRESSALSPHNEQEVAIATAEQWLSAFRHLSRGSILQTVFRLGEIYGDELDGTDRPGLLNHCLTAARHGQAIDVQGLGLRKRSLLHIADFAEMVYQLLEQDFPPEIINLPGEGRRELDFMAQIASHYRVELTWNQQPPGDDIHPGTGDLQLSPLKFKSLLEFKPRHTFRSWLRCQPVESQT